MIKLSILKQVCMLLLLLLRKATWAYEPSDFLVEGLEKVYPAYDSFEGTMYAGLLPIEWEPKEDTGKFMFWMFEPEEAAVPDTITIWLNGGPGCSSFMAGVLFEDSPVTTPLFPAGFFASDGNAPLEPNPHAWTKSTTMLYVEQPGGVGFSYGPEPETEDDVSRDFYFFLQNFYETFPQYISKRLFIFGESYAGLYVPAIAHRIYHENLKNHEHLHQIKLAGIGLGNGWIDVPIQGPAVIDYAYWHGMIDSFTRDSFHEQWKTCEAGLPQTEPFHRYTTPDECGTMGAVLQAAGAGLFPERHPNAYDVTTWDPYPVLTSLNSTYTRFYNDPRVKQALHAPMDTNWRGCIPGAGRRRRRQRRAQRSRRRLERELLLLDDDKPESVMPYLAQLLDEAGVRVIIYNGDRDMPCCAQGSEAALNSMDWTGAEEWQKTDRGVWMVEERVAGYAKSTKGLDFVIVYNSGHMVPTNQPEAALDLLTRFLQDEQFIDVIIPPIETQHMVESTAAATTAVISKEDKTKGVSKKHSLLPSILLIIVSFAAGVFLSHRIPALGAKRHEYEQVPSNGAH